MTKDVIPAGAEFNQSSDEYFESTAIASLDATPTMDWPIGIWLGLGQCHPSTAKRILVHALQLCRDRGDGPPTQLVNEISRHLRISIVPRARAKDRNLIADVAHYLVRHPRSSHRKIAAALGRRQQASTIFHLFKRPAFWAECAEQSALYDDERAHEVLGRYVEKFGRSLEYGTDRTGFAALSALVPSMTDALDGIRGPLDIDDVRAIAANQSAIRSQEALRRRLLPVEQ